MKSAKLSIAGLCVFVLFLPIFRAVAEINSSDLRPITQAVDALNENVRTALESLEEIITHDIGYPTYDVYTSFLSDSLTPSRSYTQQFSGVPAPLPQFYGFDGNFDLHGSYLSSYEKLLVDILRETQIGTFMNLSGGGNSAYWQNAGYDYRYNPASFFTNLYSRIWEDLPYELRENSVGGYGFGEPKYSGSSINFGALTSNPDNVSQSPQAALLYWLMRLTGEQYAQNRWLRMGGLYGPLPRDSIDRFDVTNNTYSPVSFTLYQDYDDANNHGRVTLPHPDIWANDGSIVYSLPAFLNYQALPLNMLDVDVQQLNFLPIPDQAFKDFGFYRFVDSFHDESYFNMPDDVTNPDNILTNFPLLYHEDTFHPWTVDNWAVPPRIENYLAFQLSQLINRGTILAYMATNGMFSVSNSLPEQLSIDTNEVANVTNDIASVQNNLLTKFSMASTFMSVTNDVNEVFGDLEENNTASLPISLDLKNSKGESIISEHIDFDLPDLSDDKFESFSDLVIWIYKLVFFFLTVSLARSEVRYWCRVVSVVDVELPDGGHVRSTDWSGFQ